MKQKWCASCKSYKNLTLFYKNKSRKDGVQTYCKVCSKHIQSTNKNRKIYQKEYDRLRYLNDKEKIQFNSKNWISKNKKRVIERSNIYNNSNAKYTTYKDKLTIDESPRLHENGVSLEVKCRYCGKYFIPRNQDTHHRVQSLNGKKSGDNGLYCSEGCKESCPIFNQKLYPKGFKQGTSREVQPQLRQLVLKRDNYECVCCNKTIDEIELHCHHIWPLNESPITSADIDECITLCIDCHKEIHMNIAGCGYYEMRCTV